MEEARLIKESLSQATKSGSASGASGGRVGITGAVASVGLAFGLRQRQKNK